MGEAKIGARSTAGFIRDFPLCCLCGGMRPTTTREHMPPKSLFDNKFRPDKLVMPACKECNGGTATADLAVSMISRWGVQESEQSQRDHSKLAARIKHQAPDLVDEWLKFDDPYHQSSARRHLEKQGVRVPANASMTAIGPNSIRLLNLFAHKAVLALYFEHFRKPLTNYGSVQAIWKTKEDFASKGIPEELLQLMGRYGTLTQGKWNASETFEYRYDLNVKDGIFGCFARLRQGVFVLGFAVENSATLKDFSILDGYWIRPSELLNANPHFSKKLT